MVVGVVDAGVTDVVPKEPAPGRDVVPDAVVDGAGSNRSPEPESHATYINAATSNTVVDLTRSPLLVCRPSWLTDLNAISAELVPTPPSDDA